MKTELTTPKAILIGMSLIAVATAANADELVTKWNDIGICVGTSMTAKTEYGIELKNQAMIEITKNRSIIKKVVPNLQKGYQCIQQDSESCLRDIYPNEMERAFVGGMFKGTILARNLFMKGGINNLSGQTALICYGL